MFNHKIRMYLTTEKFKIQDLSQQIWLSLVKCYLFSRDYTYITMKHEIQAPLIDGRKRSGIHSVCLVIQNKTKRTHLFTHNFKW